MWAPDETAIYAMYETWWTDGGFNVEGLGHVWEQEFMDERNREGVAEAATRKLRGRDTSNSAGATAPNSFEPSTEDPQEALRRVRDSHVRSDGDRSDDEPPAFRHKGDDVPAFGAGGFKPPTVLSYEEEEKALLREFRR